MLSGLNLACFSMSGLRSELEAANNNKHARRVLALREDSDLLLVTILWGDVSVSCQFPPIHFHLRYFLLISLTRLQCSLCCKCVKQP